MGNGGSSVRSASRINDVNLLRALPSRQPETTADKLRVAMLTAGNAKRPVDAPQSDGVYCPSCGKSHRAGTVCPVAKSFFFHQAFRELCKGNDWHDRKTGQFTSRGSGTRSAVSSHTGKHGPGEGRKGASKDTAQLKKRGKERSESAKKQKKRVTEPSEQAGRATAEIGKPKADKPGHMTEARAAVAAMKERQAGEKAAREKRELERASTRALSSPKADARTDASKPASKTPSDAGGGDVTGAAGPAAKRRQADIGTVELSARRPGAEAAAPGSLTAEQRAEEEHTNLVEEAMSREPKKFEGGAMTPRADQYEVARRSGARAHQDQAYEHAKLQGADNVTANQVAQQAWQDHHAAHQYARANNIPVEMVAGNERNLAARARAETPPPGMVPDQARSGTAQAIQTLRGGDAQAAQPTPTAEAAQTLREQFPAGQATVREEAPVGSQTIKETLPAGAAAGAIARDEAKQPATPTPTPETPPTEPGAQSREPAPSRRGVSFSQMYGAGSSIGAGLGTPGGSIAPTAGLGAQQVHHLLNPQLRREAAPAMATQGAPRAGPISPQASRGDPRVRSPQQSLRQ